MWELILFTGGVIVGVLLTWGYFGFHVCRQPLPNTIENLLKGIQKSMATQEERLQAVVAKLGAIQAGIDKLQEQVATLKANNPDLEDELTEIEETIGAMDADVNPPAPEPTPEG